MDQGPLGAEGLAPHNTYTCTSTFRVDAAGVESLVSLALRYRKNELIRKGFMSTDRKGDRISLRLNPDVEERRRRFKEGLPGA